MPAMKTADENYNVFVLSVDDLEWTRHWLKPGQRCDQLLVFVARSPDIHPQIRVRAVESKSSSKVDAPEPHPGIDPYREAIEQVTCTLDALWRLLEQDGTDPLVEDLQFTVFMEHLASVALSDLYPIGAGNKGDVYALTAISNFSLDRDQSEIAMDGVAVCTYYRTSVVRKAARCDVPGEDRSWPMFLVRAGATQVDALLGSGVSEMLRASEVEDDSSSEPKVDKAEEQVRVPDESGDRTEAATVRADKKIAKQGELVDEGNSEPIMIANDLFLACQQRGFRVQKPHDSNVTVGPSLISISMEIEAGTSIRPIEQATADLAREVGVPEISVANDPDRPFHLRFLVARKDRFFPTLPSQPAPLVGEDSQSYLGFFLGQTLDGEDYASFLSSWPHMLIAGTSGSGKTTFLQSLLRQVSMRDAKCINVAVVDGKGEIDYLGILDEQHFTPKFPEVLLGRARVNEVLEWVVDEEIPRRRKYILERAKAGVGSRPQSAREIFVSALVGETEPPFPVLLVVIDEFAEIMLGGRGAGAREFEKYIQQITQVGRSTLVHLVVATQRPDIKVISGAIKANLDARVALRLPQHQDSMTVLGGKGAEGLLGLGDLIFKSAGQPPTRLQGYSS